MQNKHYFFFPFWESQRSGRGGGVKPVGPKSQLLPKICFGGFPNQMLENTSYLSHISFYSGWDHTLPETALYGSPKTANSNKHPKFIKMSLAEQKINIFLWERP